MLNGTTPENHHRNRGTLVTSEVTKNKEEEGYWVKKEKTPSGQHFRFCIVCMQVSFEFYYGILNIYMYPMIQNQKGFWLKINTIQMKLPNFDNWSNGELSKIGHHFSNKRL